MRTFVSFRLTALVPLLLTLPLLSPATGVAASQPEATTVRAWLDANVSLYMERAKMPGFSIAVRHLLTHSLGYPSLATSTVAISRGLGRDTGIPSLPSRSAPACSVSSGATRSIAGSSDSTSSRAAACSTSRPRTPSPPATRDGRVDLLLGRYYFHRKR